MTSAKIPKGGKEKDLVFVEDLSCVGSSSKYQHYKVKKTPVPAQRRGNKQGTQSSAVQCKIPCQWSRVGHLKYLPGKKNRESITDITDSKKDLKRDSEM